jgi:type II secretory pathway pseudopilin PulG
MMLQISRDTKHEGEQGFLLLGVIVLIFLMLLALSVAAPKVAQSLRRDREVEAIHRGNEYVMAIRRYYLKFGHYPGNMDQLEKSNNIRFLRQKYEDPMTGKPDWRLIHTGEAKTTVKGFFGQPLSGMPGAGAGGLGAASSMVSGQPTSTVGGASTSTSPGGSGGFSLGPGVGSSSGSGSGPTGGSSNSPAGGASTVSSGAGSGSNSSGFGGGIGGQSATSFSGGGAPIVGVGSSKSGGSISVVNEQTTYETWEFLYDPRIEQMKAKAALLGGPASGGSGSSMGSGPIGTPIGGSSPGGTTSPTSPTSPSPSGTTTPQ